MSKRIDKNVRKLAVLLLLACLAGAVVYKKTADVEKEPFYGTWRIEKVALISDMYTGTTLDGDYEEYLYDSEDFLGYELEYTERYFRLGDKKYKNPEYVIKYRPVDSVDSGIKAKPGIYTFLAEEEILADNDEDYTGETLLLWFDVDFADEVSYGKYNFIPVGTQCILLNEDAMIVGIWGKTLLARRI